MGISEYWSEELRARRENGDTEYRIDDIDRKIIDAMAYQARISNAALARLVGLSESATLERVRRLEKTGVILGYSTRFDNRALQRNVTALVTIRLVSQSHDHHDGFLRGIIEIDEVLSCFQVMGSCDFVAHVAAKDVEALEHVITRRLLKLPAVERTESMFVLKMIKRQMDPPDEYEATTDEDEA